MNKALPLLIGLALSYLNLMGQNDTIIYYGANGAITSKADAIKYVQVEATKKSKYRMWTYYKQEDQWEKHTYFKELIPENDSVYIIRERLNKKMSITLTRMVIKQEDGSYYIKNYAEHGTLLSEGISQSIFPLHKIGEYKVYSPKGNLVSIAQYKDNQLQSNQNWKENGDKAIDNVFSSVDEMPLFKESEQAFLGEKAISNHVAKNIRYPHMAMKNGIQGTVYVNFVIMEDGQIKDITLLRGIGGGCDQEAMRVIGTMKKWTPGKLNGKVVRVSYNLPVRYLLR